MKNTVYQNQVKLAAFECTLLSLRGISKAEVYMLWWVSLMILKHALILATTFQLHPMYWENCVSTLENRQTNLIWYAPAIIALNMWPIVCIAAALLISSITDCWEQLSIVVTAKRPWIDHSTWVSRRKRHRSSFNIGWRGWRFWLILSGTLNAIEQGR